MIEASSVGWREQCAVVVPCFNEAATIGSVVAAVRKILPGVLVVDDGSTDNTAEIARLVGAEVINHPRNLGKGAALGSGLRRARERGFASVIMMDGDGQHAAEDIPEFLHRAEAGTAVLIVGNRMGNCATMPLLRKLANWSSSWLISRRAGRKIPDTQCGFRMVQLEAWSKVQPTAAGFEIEAEMVLAFIAAGLPVEFVPIRTIYGNEHSKFHPIFDTWRWLRWLAGGG